MNYYDTNSYHIKYAGSIIKLKMWKIARLLPCTAQRISACKKVVSVTYDLLPRHRGVAGQVTRPTCAHEYVHVHRKQSQSW